MVMVKYGNIKASMDGYLHDNLELYKKMVKLSRDLVIIGAGREREGKSVFVNSILKYLDPTYNISRCCFEPEEFLKQMKEAKNFQAVCLDEAQSFSSRGALTRLNKVLIKGLSMIGIKQLYLGIVLPSFFELDKYPAIHRSNFLVRVYSHKGHRGFFEFWNWEKKKKLYLFGKKGYDYQVVQPNFRGRFVDKAFPFNWDEYNAKKLEAIDKMEINFRDYQLDSIAQRDELIKYLYDIMGLKQLKIAEIIAKSGKSITQQGISRVLGKNNTTQL